MHIFQQKETERKEHVNYGKFKENRNEWVEEGKKLVRI